MSHLFLDLSQLLKLVKKYKKQKPEIIPKIKNPEFHWLEGGEHSWKPRKKDLISQEQLMEEASIRIKSFCEQLLANLS